MTNRTINSIIINFITFSIDLNNNKHHCKYNILILIIACITLVLLSLFLVPCVSIGFCGLIKEKEDNKLLQGKRKVDAILDMPAPTNVSFLRSFLGSIQFYGKFIKDLPTLTEPLYFLLQKGVPWR